MYRLRSGDRVLSLHPGAWAVGRLPTAGIFVNDSEVSRQHAILHVDERGVELEDLKSRNGSFVNGVQVTGRFTLRAGDRLRFGLVEFILENDTSKPPAQVKDYTPINKVPGTYPGTRPPSVTQPPPGSAAGVPGPAATLEIHRSAMGVLAPPPQRAHVVLCVGDTEWAERLRRALAVEQNFVVVTATPANIAEVAAAAPPGCLLLDADAVGKATVKVLEVWWGPDRRRGPVMIVATKPEHEGVVLARNLGAQAYVRAGKGADMVVAQMRYQIQRASVGKGA